MLNTTKLKLEHVEVTNLNGAIRGMRNPLESHHLSDSYWSNHSSIDEENNKEYIEEFIIGPNDLKLAMQLKKAGSDHRKFLRQIFVSFDLTMPEYFWKQYHTYKVSTVENSTSQMHTLGKRLLTPNDFIFDNEEDHILINRINNLILEWQNTKDKEIWRRIIQLMPQSYLYKKTCTLTYENLINMYNARKNHKLDEWQWFIRNIIKQCPYAEELICN